MRCGLYIKVGETFRRTLPPKTIETTDANHWIIDDPPDYEGIKITESCFERLLNGYSKLDCFNNNLKEIINNKLKEISEID